jgi:hypothetical protein
MVAADEGEPPAETNEDEEIAKWLARLTGEQRLLYMNQLQNLSDVIGEISHSYQLQLAGTLAKGLPANELSREIKELNRREQQDAYWRGQKSERDADRAKPLEEHRHQAEQDAARPHAAVRDAQSFMAEQLARAAPRDFNALQRSHEQAAEQMRAQAQHLPPQPAPQARQVPPDALSTEQLQAMLELYSAVRREHALPHGHAEMQEQATLSAAQFSDRKRVEQSHGATPTQQQQELRLLLDYQHFAEEAGMQAKWLAHDLKTQRPAESDQYLKEARQAFQIARLLHERRQELEHEFAHSPELPQGISPEQRKAHQSALGQSPSEGGEVNVENANVSREATQSMPSQESRQTGRATNGAGSEHGSQQSKGGTGRSGGGRGR